MTYYFAWVDAPTGTPVWDNAYKREDEKVFGYTLSQEEGEFACLTVEIENPNVGLLAPSRKRWAWFSRDNTPLFCGRLVGMPSDIQERVITLEFTARPVNYLAAKEAAADALRTGENYDGIFALEDSSADKVLEGYSALWHVDRVTHAITASDLVDGEDGTIQFDESELLQGSLKVKIGAPPAQDCNVSVTVTWTQAGTGTIDLTNDIINEFAEVSTAALQDLDGNGVQLNETGGVSLIGAEGMADAWPKWGTDIGKGWKVGYSSLQFVGVTPGASMVTGPAGIENLSKEALQRFSGTRYSGIFCASAYGTTFIPIVPVAPHLELDWKVAREKSETITLHVSSDLQELVTDESDVDPLEINLKGRVDVVLPGETTPPIGSILRRGYFPTDRGQQTLRYAALVAHAALKSSARCIEISGAVDIDDGLAISLRKNITVTTDMLPQGTATGKVIAYELSMKDGEEEATFTIGCCVGQDSSLVEVLGDPVYVEADYCDGYQVYSGGYELTDNGSVATDTSAIYAVAPTDDGVDFGYMDKAHLVKSISVVGGLNSQLEEIAEETTTPQGGAYMRQVSTPVNETRAKLQSVTTTCTVTLQPIGSGPYVTDYGTIEATSSIPKMVDLG